MSGYIPDTKEQQAEMMKETGIKDIEELFSPIPHNVRHADSLKIPEAVSEMELIPYMRKLASKNRNTDDYTCFLGAGAYDHFIPSAVNSIITRQEFYTAYTPYQPEISQGTLQAIYEYQTMICELTGMDVSNASMYDGATALAEAVFMACEDTKRQRVLLARTVHPQYRQVLKTYSHFRGIFIEEIGYDNGGIDIKMLEQKISDDVASVCIQSPNFFGVIENIQEVVEIAHRKGVVVISCVDPISLAILKSPGESGADMAVGEGQCLGSSLSFGGPYLGFMAVKQKYLRKMPGRITGETTDKNGDKGFVLTIQTREQHIRRGKATSNICSNQALNALAACVYMSLLGKNGMQKVAELCINKAHYTFEKLIHTGKFSILFGKAPFFKEFALKSSIPVKKLNKLLIEKKIIGGYDLGKDYPELSDCLLMCVTEKRTREEIDTLADIIGGAVL
jgi:glycine dehydrogenase subunit 1